MEERRETNAAGQMEVRTNRAMLVKSDGGVDGPKALENPSPVSRLIYKVATNMRSATP